MKRDHILLAALLGGLSTLAGEIITKILVAMHIGLYAVFELNSLLITSNRPSMLIGFIINFVIGSFAGTLLFLTLDKLGTRHVIVKCALASLLLWFLFELGFTSMIEDKYIPIRPITDHLVHVAGTVTFGIVFGALLRLFLFRNRAFDK